MDFNALLPFASRKIGNAFLPDNPIWAEVSHHGVKIEISSRAYFQPDSTRYFYFVGQGSFSSLFMDRKGRKRQLLVYEVGAVLNLTCAIIKSASFLEYLAIEDSILWKLPVEFIMNDDTMCPRLTKMCLRFLAYVVETYYTGLTYLKVDKTNQSSKVFCRYLILAMRNANSKEFSQQLTQDDCASLLGMHRATLARVIRDLKQQGILGCFTSKKVKILDVEKLLQLADF